jgi:hypothetical protein
MKTTVATIITLAFAMASTLVAAQPVGPSDAQNFQHRIVERIAKECGTTESTAVGKGASRVLDVSKLAPPKVEASFDDIEVLEELRALGFSSVVGATNVVQGPSGARVRVDKSQIAIVDEPTTAQVSGKCAARPKRLVEADLRQ